MNPASASGPTNPVVPRRRKYMEKPHRLTGTVVSDTAAVVFPVAHIGSLPLRSRRSVPLPVALAGDGPWPGCACESLLGVIQRIE